MNTRLMGFMVLFVCIALVFGTVNATEFVPQMGHKVQVNVIAISPDGKLIASGDADGRVMLWQATGGMLVRELTPEGATVAPALVEIGAEAAEGSDGAVAKSDGVQFGGEGGVAGLAFPKDSPEVLAIDRLGRLVRLPWDGTAVNAVGVVKGRPLGLVVTSDGRVAAVTTAGVSWLSKREEGMEALECKLTGRDVTAFVLGPDQESVVLGHADGTVTRWPAGSCPEAAVELPVPAGSAIKSLAFHSAGAWLIVAHDNGRVDNVEVGNPENIKRIEATTRGPVAVAVSDDASWVAVAYDQGRVRRFSLTDGLQSDAIEVSDGAIGAMAYSNALGALVVAGGFGALSYYPTAGKMGEEKRLGVRTSTDYFAMFSPDGKRLIVSPRNSSLPAASSMHVWNLATMKLGKAPAVPEEMWIWGRWTGNGERFFLRENGGGHLVWDLAQNQQVLYWDNSMGLRMLQALTPDGKKCLVSEDRMLSLLTCRQNAEKPWREADLTEWPTHADYSADGNRMLLGTDSAVSVWDANKLKLIWSSEAEAGVWHSGGQLMSADLSDSGNLALTCGSEGSVVLWDLKARKPMKRLVAGEGACWSVTFAGGDKRALIGTMDGRGIVWDLEKGLLTAVVQGDRALVADMALSTDGKEVRMAQTNGTVHAYDIATLKRQYSIYRDEAGEWALLGQEQVTESSAGGKSLLGIREGAEVKPVN